MVVLFDIGETLLDTTAQQAALVAAHREVLADHGFPLSESEYAALDLRMMQTFVPSPMHAVTWHLARPNVDLFDRITERIRARYPEIRKQPARLYPGVVELLSVLSRTHPLALAGNAPATIRDSLRALEILQFFTHTVVSADIGVSKPDLRFFETILADAGASPEAALLVADRLDNDIIPAKRLGMVTIWVRQGRYAPLEPRTPDEIPNATVSCIKGVLAAFHRLAGDGGPI